MRRRPNRFEARGVARRIIRRLLDPEGAASAAAAIGEPAPLLALSAYRRALTRWARSKTVG